VFQSFLTNSERHRIYDLTDADLLAINARMTKTGDSFIIRGVGSFIENISKAPKIGEPFLRHGDALRTLLVDHYRQLFYAHDAENQSARSEQTMDLLVQHDVDLRAMFTAAAHIFKACVSTHKQIGLRLSIAGNLDTLAIIQRLIMLDCGSMLNAHQRKIIEVSEVRTGQLSKWVDGFANDISAISKDLRASSTAVSEMAGRCTEAASSALIKSREAAEAASGSSSILANSSSNTEQLSMSAQELDQRSAMARESVVEAEKAAAAADDAMAQLQAMAASIGSIVDLISSIAGQTNLLALNATIEAARAGEAGRGFAVVASEVKALAAQTTEATQRIISQIDSVQAGTVRSSQEIGAVRAAIAKLAASATEVSDAAAGQRRLAADLSEQISEAVTLVRGSNHGCRAAAQMIEINATEANAALKSMTEMAKLELRLNSAVSDFATKVRAA
jgi:methyl-accepting chemotaxis protein